MSFDKKFKSGLYTCLQGNVKSKYIYQRDFAFFINTSTNTKCLVKKYLRLLVFLFFYFCDVFTTWIFSDHRIKFNANLACQL